MMEDRNSRQNFLPSSTYAVFLDPLKINVVFNIRPSQVPGDSEPKRFLIYYSVQYCCALFFFFFLCLQDVNQVGSARRWQSKVLLLQGR